MSGTKRRATVFIVAGTRPEVIKLWPVATALRKHSSIRVININSGQHGDLADQAYRVLAYKYQRNLRVMERKQTLSSLTSTLVQKLHREMKRLQPDLVVVQGDTATAFAAALVAYYRRIPVALMGRLSQKVHSHGRGVQ